MFLPASVAIATSKACRAGRIIVSNMLMHVLILDLYCAELHSTGGQYIQSRYSCRSASTGSRVAARHAG